VLPWLLPVVVWVLLVLLPVEEVFLFLSSFFLLYSCCLLIIVSLLMRALAWRDINLLALVIIGTHHHQTQEEAGTLEVLLVRGEVEKKQLRRKRQK